MKLRKFLFVISTFYVFTFYSCNESNDNNKTINIDKFPKIKTIVAKQNKWINPYMPIGILQIDSFLVIVNFKGKNVFQIYNTNTKKMVSECGKFGKGPKEFTIIRLTGQIKKNKQTRLFYAYSEINKSIFAINLDSLLIGNISISDENTLPTRFIVQTHIINIDSLIIGVSDESGGKTFIYNTKNKNLGIWDYYPKIEDIQMLNDYEKYVLYARMWVYNKQYRLLAGAYNTYFNKLVYYDINGELIKSIDMPKSDFQIKHDNILGKAPTYSTGIIHANNKIYLSTYPYKYKNIEQPYKSVLNVFDWDGNPIIQYVIKNVLIRMFVVDKINNKIYAYCPDNADLLMVEFDL